MKYQQVIDFVNAGSNYLKDAEESKLTYAIRKMSGRLKPIIDEYNELTSDLKIDACSVDDKGNLVMGDGGKSYTFKPDKLKELNKKMNELNKKECPKFEPYFATELPKDFKEDFREYFEGFVIE